MTLAKRGPHIALSLTLTIHTMVLLFPLMGDRIEIAPPGIHRISLQLKQVKVPSPSQPKVEQKKKKRDSNPLSKKLSKTLEKKLQTPQQQSSQSLPFEQVIQHYVEPRYPRTALRRNMQGMVELELHVNELGEVSKVLLISSSGHQVLDMSAIRAARQWRFKPDTAFVTKKRINYIINQI